MKTKTAADRSRASRLRKKADLSESEKAWLDEYESNKSSSKPPASHKTPKKEPDSEKMVDIFDVYDGNSSAGLEDDDDDEEEESRPVTSVAPVPVPTPTTPSICTVPGCPACARRSSATLTCGVTNEPVAAPMSEQAGYAMARGVFAVLGQLLKYFRPDLKPLPPTNDEVNALGSSLAILARRRAPSVVGYDDLLGTFGGMTMYLARIAGTR